MLYSVQRHDEDNQDCMISLLGQVVNTVHVSNTTKYILEIRNLDGDEVLEQVMLCKGHPRGVLAKMYAHNDNTFLIELHANAF